MIKTHYLKTWPEYFQAVMDGKKPFELRNNDRDFRVGDTLVLEEFNPDTQEYTGREILAEVTYVLNEFSGIVKGYVILGIDMQDIFCRQRVVDKL